MYSLVFLFFCQTWSFTKTVVHLSDWIIIGTQYILNKQILVNYTLKEANCRVLRGSLHNTFSFPSVIWFSFPNEDPGIAQIEIKIAAHYSVPSAQKNAWNT